VRDRYDTSTLDYVLHTAAPCATEIKQQMLDWWGPVIHEVYAGIGESRLHMDRA
jgi:hypothetical protein